MRGKFSNGTYDVNPLVESGEYERVFAGEVEVGDVLAAYGDSEVTDVTPAPWADRVSLTLGGLDTVSLRRGTVLLVKVPECQDCRDAQSMGYTKCGECGAPGERWEYTTPEEVYTP